MVGYSSKKSFVDTKINVKDILGEHKAGEDKGTEFPKETEGSMESDIAALVGTTKEEKEKGITYIALKYNKKEQRVKQQLEIFEEDVGEKKELSDAAKRILLEEKNQEEIESYKVGINWVDDEYFNTSWKRLKGKNIKQLKESDKLFQLFPSGGKITGKPQILDNEHKTPITLLLKAVKKSKDNETIISYKFIDDTYNKRDDGYEEDILEKNFLVYSFKSYCIKYLVMCEDKLKNHEVHTFYGADIRVPHKKEFDKNLACRGSANFFFCQKAESTIKPRARDELIPYVRDFIKKNGLSSDGYKALMKDYIFTHKNGFIYNQLEDYTIMRHAQLLSGKSDGYPLHLFVWSGFGGGKTQELECLDNIFQEGILEAANSTPKSLVPSFSGAIPEPGFLIKSSRVALVDELMKMIDNAVNNTRNSSDVKNQLANLNFILEHRERSANSGNGGIFCMPTMKTIMVMNPSRKSSYIHQELEVIDSSTMSRILPFVKGQKHLDFIETNKLENCANRYLLYYTNNDNNNTIRSKVRVFAQLVREFYVTIYDSCQAFTTIDEQGFLPMANSLKNLGENLAKNPMKTVWKRRGLHHSKLLLDGVIKYRRLFSDVSDVTDSWAPTQEDYDICERILIEMVNGWSENMSVNNETTPNISKTVPVPAVYPVQPTLTFKEGVEKAWKKKLFQNN